jgi:hypothetical protein
MKNSVQDGVQNRWELPFEVENPAAPGSSVVGDFRPRTLAQYLKGAKVYFAVTQSQTRFVVKLSFKQPELRRVEGKT